MKGTEEMNFDRIERWYFAPESNSGAGLGNLEVSEETEMEQLCYVNMLKIIPEDGFFSYPGILTLKRNYPVRSVPHHSEDISFGGVVHPCFLTPKDGTIRYVPFGGAVHPSPHSGGWTFQSIRWCVVEYPDIGVLL